MGQLELHNTIRIIYRWLRARLQYLHSYRTGDTAFIYNICRAHFAISVPEIHYNSCYYDSSLQWRNMNVKESEITGDSTVCPTDCPCWQQRNYACSFMKGIHYRPHKGPVMRKAFPCLDAHMPQDHLWLHKAWQGCQIALHPPVNRDQEL